MTLTILIPAAGSSSRMRGRDKLLELVGDEAILRRQARLALDASPLVIVTLRVADRARSSTLQGLKLRLIPIPDAATGMAASLRRGVQLADANGLMILPADMPDLTSDDLRGMLASFAETPDHILRATDAAGTQGHPVIFPAALYPEIAMLQADQGARAILARHKVRLFALPDAHATTDLDTPEDWSAWRGHSRNNTTAS